MKTTQLSRYIVQYTYVRKTGEIQGGLEVVMAQGVAEAETLGLERAVETGHASPTVFQVLNMDKSSRRRVDCKYT